MKGKTGTKPGEKSRETQCCVRLHRRLNLPRRDLLIMALSNTGNSELP
jgi:hypothetical protein